MKVKDLIKELEKYKEREIFLSSDTEGNNYGTFEGEVEKHGENIIIFYPTRDHLDIDELDEYIS